MMPASPSLGRYSDMADFLERQASGGGSPESAARLEANLRTLALLGEN